MSRTIHTTPSFPRTLRGPRGGRHIAPTPCVECVSFTSCRPGACSAPYGCESWVDEDGRRVDVLADLDIDPQAVDLAALDEPDPEPDWEARHRLPTGLLKSHGGILHNPDPEDPNPYAPSSATLSETTPGRSSGARHPTE